MAQSINIHSIIEEVSELNDLLKVISECNGNIPSILYKLAQEKASAIAENISSLSRKQPETIAEPSAPEQAVETQQQTEELPPVQETQELIIAQSVQQTPEPEEPKIEENDILPNLPLQMKKRTYLQNRNSRNSLSRQQRNRLSTLRQRTTV